MALDAPLVRNPGQWGAWYLTGHGYVQRMRRVPNPEGGRGTKERQYQHHVVWEEAHGPLLENQNIHHKNGDRTDNRLENLELWDTSQPAGQRAEDKLAHAREIFERYAPMGEVWIQQKSNEVVTLEER